MSFPSKPIDDAPAAIWKAWLHYLRRLPAWSAALECDIKHAITVLHEKDAERAVGRRASFTSTELGVSAFLGSEVNSTTGVGDYQITNSTLIPRKAER
jgi:hypothetical protein